MFGKPKFNPQRIWSVIAISKDTGELYIARCFRYKCEALQYERYLQAQEIDKVFTTVTDVMLY